MTRKKTDPKTKLAAAFVEVASREGVDRVTLEAVAKRARIPFSTAHYHLKQAGLGIVEFGLRAVGANAQRFIEAYLASDAGNAANPLRRYFEGSFAWMRENRAHANIWLFQYHLIAVNSAIRATHQPFLDAAARRIEGLLFESVGKGFYPAPSRGSAPGEIAIAIHGLLMGIMTRALVSGTGTGAPDSAIDRHLDLALRSIESLIALPARAGSKT